MLLKHSLIYLIARGLPAVVNLGALSLFTRLISPEDYGHYAMVIAATGLLNSLLFQWQRFGMVRYLPTYEGSKEAFLSTVTFGLVVSILITGIIGTPVILLLQDPVLKKFALFGLALLWVQSSYAIVLELARAQLAPKRYGITELIKALVVLGVGGLLAYRGEGAVGLLWGMLAGYLFSLMWGSLWGWKGIRLRLVDRALMRKLMAYGLPLSATVGLNFITASSDRFLLGYFLGSDAAGSYAVGYDLAQRTLGVVMMIVNLAGYPLVTHAMKGDPSAVRRQLQQNLILLLAVAVPAATGMALLAPQIAGLLLGARFTEVAQQLIPWIAAGVLLSGVKSYYADFAYQLGEFTLGQIWVVGAAALANVLLNLWLIPIVGLMGAAYSTLAAYSLGLLLSCLWGRRYFRLPGLSADAVKIFLAASFMAAVLWPARNLELGVLTLTGQVSLGVAAYALAMLFLNVKGSREQLQRLLVRRTAPSE